MSNKNKIIQDQKAEIATLRNSLEMKNSLSALASSASSASHLTSLTPIIQNNVYYPVTLNYVALMYMYKTHGVIQTAIDMPVLDAFRGGLDFTSRELSMNDLEDFSIWLEEKRILGVFGDAVIWKRLFGGSALVINVPTDAKTPLALGAIKADNLEFYDASRWELMAPSAESKTFNFYGKEVDRSRVLTMHGKRAPFIIRNQLSGWGMSEIERMIADFNLYLQTKNVLYEILDEAKIDVYRMDGFRETLASPNGTELTRQRLTSMNQLKNFHNALLLDKEDEYDQKQLSFSGLAEIMKENRIGIASALRMPITKLFGLSATGFNSGEDDIENYNAMVESEVREPARPQLRQVLKLCVRAFFGDDYDFQFKFKPLRMMTSSEEETVKNSMTTRILNLYDRMLLSSEEVGEIAHKEGLVNIDTAMARGELDEHPLSPEMGMGGAGEGGAEDGGEDKAAGDWHMSPTGKMRRKLKSGRWEYRKPGSRPQEKDGKDGQPEKPKAVGGEKGPEGGSSEKNKEEK